VPVTFPLIQTLPAAGAATVTAISLLAGPAANDASLGDQVCCVACEVVSPLPLSLDVRLSTAHPLLSCVPNLPPPPKKTVLQVSVNGAPSQRALVNHVYRLYGLDATELDVDFFSFTGAALQLGSPHLAQVSRHGAGAVQCWHHVMLTCPARADIRTAPADASNAT
jgi:hypothetical protein